MCLGDSPVIGKCRYNTILLVDIDKLPNATHFVIEKQEAGFIRLASCYEEKS
jgi:hypothetical protein